MSALRPKADIRHDGWDVRLVPKAAVSNRSKADNLFDHLVSAGERDGGISRPSIPGGLAWMTNSQTWWMLNNRAAAPTYHDYALELRKRGM